MVIGAGSTAALLPCLHSLKDHFLTGTSLPGRIYLPQVDTTHCKLWSVYATKFDSREWFL
jgi:hypothetical protein